MKHNTVSMRLTLSKLWKFSNDVLGGVETVHVSIRLIGIGWDTLLGTNISPEKSILKMIFLFQRWDMLVSWRVIHNTGECFWGS